LLDVISIYNVGLIDTLKFYVEKEQIIFGQIIFALCAKLSVYNFCKQTTTKIG